MTDHGIWVGWLERRETQQEFVGSHPSLNQFDRFETKKQG